MTENQKPKIKPFEAVRQQINTIRAGFDPDFPGDLYNQRKMPEFERNQKVALKVTSDMRLRGSFFRNTDIAYYHIKESGELITIEDDGVPISRFLGHYGLNATEKIFKYVVEAIYQFALEHGADTIVRHFSHLRYTDEGIPILCIAMDNSRVLQITPDRIFETENGTDGVLFLAESNACPSGIQNFISEKRKNLHSKIINLVPFNTQVLDISESRFMMECEIYGLFLRDLYTTNPIYAYIGEKGSGKSTAVKLIGQILYGLEWDVFDIGNDQKDFDAMVTSRTFVCLDNADENVKWLNNKLAIIASGGKIARRILFKTNRFADYPIIAMVATTSRTPCFRRDDVADRLLILKTNRLTESGYSDFNDDLIMEANSCRNEIWGEILANLQKIVRGLADPQWKSIKVKGIRLQGFARLTAVINKALNRGINVSSLWSKESVLQIEFASENEVVLDLLEIWTRDHPGEKVTAGELHSGLRKIAQDQDTEYPYKSSYSLASRLNQLKVKLEESYGMTIEIGSDKQNMYSFRKAGVRK